MRDEQSTSSDYSSLGSNLGLLLYGHVHMIFIFFKSAPPSLRTPLHIFIWSHDDNPVSVEKFLDADGSLSYTHVFAIQTGKISINSSLYVIPLKELRLWNVNSLA